MIRDWISGLDFFIPLSFHPGAAAKGNFLSLFLTMCETEVGGWPGIAFSLCFSYSFHPFFFPSSFSPSSLWTETHA